MRQMASDDSPELAMGQRRSVKFQPRSTVRPGVKCQRRQQQCQRNGRKSTEVGKSLAQHSFAKSCLAAAPTPRRPKVEWRTDSDVQNLCNAGRRVEKSADDPLLVFDPYHSEFPPSVDAAWAQRLSMGKTSLTRRRPAPIKSTTSNPLSGSIAPPPAPGAPTLMSLLLPRGI